LAEGTANFDKERYEMRRSRIIIPALSALAAFTPLPLAAQDTVRTEEVQPEDSGDDDTLNLLGLLGLIGLAGLVPSKRAKPITVDARHRK
jgi:hypothetical protein